MANVNQTIDFETAEILVLIMIKNLKEKKLKMYLILKNLK